MTAADSKKRKARTALDEMDADGRFQRSAAGFDNPIDTGTEFAPETGRYHLYVSLACPWAAGTLAALKHKGLDDVVSHSVVHPTWRKTRPDDPDDDHTGWHFKSPGDDPVSNALGHGSFDCDDALIPDTVNGFSTVRELYEKADDRTGKYTTPVLWCKKKQKIVCNESLSILKLLDGSFGDLAKFPDRRLFPDDDGHAPARRALNDYIYPTVNNGVYRCGFAKTQGAYEEAHAELFASLERLEAHVQKQHQKGRRYLTDTDDLTWIDLRLYMTLVRFDPVYVVYFKTSHRKIESDYPNLLRFVRTCYALPAIKAATNVKHIKMHYFSSHPTLNTYGIVPVSNGPDLSLPNEEQG